MTRRVVVLAGTVLVLSLAMPAGARTPQGSCPPKLEGPIAIASLDPELQEFATFLDTQVGGNGDGKICIGILAPETPGEGLNILDNRVAGF